MPYPSKTNPDAILETALEILERDGPDALSMRNLADALEIKAPSLYRHFADRSALEDAIADEGARLLRDALEEVSGSTNPTEAVQSAANAHLEFARSRPALYNLLTTRPQPSTGNAKALWNVVLRLIGGVTGNLDDTAGAVALWSFLHGYASLERAGLFGPSGDQGGFDAGLTAIIEGLPRVKPRRSR
jgi:AcrR family transcriptional regulator